MNRYFHSLLTLTLLSLAAFGGSIERTSVARGPADQQGPDYVGTWVIDNQKTLELNQGVIDSMVPDGAPEEARAQAREQMTKMFGQMKLEITLAKNGQATGVSTSPAMGPGDEPETSKASGTWKANDSSVSITMTGEDDEQSETVTGRMQGAHLILEMGGGIGLKVALMRPTTSFVGTWKLDPKKLLQMNGKTFAAMLPENMPESAREMAMERMAEMFSQMDVEIVLAADGSATGVAKMPSMIPGSEASEDRSSGTWKASGKSVDISLKGESDDSAETETGTLVDGYLVLEVDQAGQKLKLPLKRVVTAPVAGTWVLDSDMMVELNVSEMLKDVPEEQAEMARQMMESMFKSMKMEIVLTADGKANATMTKPAMPGSTETDEDRASGTWKLDGDMLSITMQGEDDPEPETATGKLEGNRVVLKMEQGGRTISLPLVRR